MMKGILRSGEVALFKEVPTDRFFGLAFRKEGSSETRRSDKAINFRGP
jgi:hypothetical protein